MKVEIEVTAADLALLYLATGNPSAGRIVLEAARRFAELNPPQRKIRSIRRRKSERPAI